MYYLNEAHQLNALWEVVPFVYTSSYAFPLRN